MTTNTATRNKATSASKGTSGSKMSPAKAKAVTDQEQAAQLDSLVMAVKVGYNAMGTQDTKHAEIASLFEQTTNALNDSRVIVARALAMLATHPATFAKSGPTKGQPALSTIATLTGFKRTTLYPVWESALILTDRKWHKRNVAPTQQERDIVAAQFAAKQTTRKEADAAKGDAKETKGKTAAVKTLKAGSLEDVVAVLADALKVVQAFTKDHGITESQFEGFGKQLDLIHDALDTAVAGTVAADADDSAE